MSVTTAARPGGVRSNVRGFEWAGLIGLALVVAVSLVLRTQGLLSLPIFTDEAIYLHWASDIWEQRSRLSLLIPIAADGKQPLFMWLAGGAMQLVQEPLLAGRLVSALVGVAGTVGMYFAGSYLAGRRAGIAAALLHATAPFTLLFDRMALADGLLTVTAIWALFFTISIAGGDRPDRPVLLSGIGLGIALAAAIWTKMTALFLLPFPLLGLLLVRTLPGLRRAGLGLVVGYALFGVFAVLLALMPNSSNLVDKTSHFSLSIQELLMFPTEIWASNAGAYWSWITAYLPAPLYWLVLLAAPWGLVYRRRHALMLLACWAVFAIPPLLTAEVLYTTRYVVPSVIPLMLLTAEFISWTVERVRTRWQLDRFRTTVATAGLLLVAALPSAAFDLLLIEDPSRANLAETDRWQYVEGEPAGYGFIEAVGLVIERLAQYEGNVIVLSESYPGLPNDGLAVYLKGMPGVYHYVDRHVMEGGTGIVGAWRSHNVPLLIVSHDASCDLDAFERAVPEAKRLGIFRNPYAQHAFRVYEIDLPRLGEGTA